MAGRLLAGNDARSDRRILYAVGSVILTNIKSRLRTVMVRFASSTDALTIASVQIGPQVGAGARFATFDAGYEGYRPQGHGNCGREMGLDHHFDYSATRL